ncbi:hypothetical protein JOB18_035865 [Solea senegalensis]|uniref:Uncharacterized protein n=1 Tax=Solea senegalensis TaxID=28829 RepID=A0AAV6R6C3_SOLSE|nr:hypothetical protein JOB18_035865 [Solea senegalensis]
MMTEMGDVGCCNRPDLFIMSSDLSLGAGAMHAGSQDPLAWRGLLETATPPSPYSVLIHNSNFSQSDTRTGAVDMVSPIVLCDIVSLQRLLVKGHAVFDNR